MLPAGELERSGSNDWSRDHTRGSMTGAKIEQDRNRFSRDRSMPG
jgi:hypothetical protein